MKESKEWTGGNCESCGSRKTFRKISDGLIWEDCLDCGRENEVGEAEHDHAGDETCPDGSCGQNPNPPTAQMQLQDLESEYGAAFIVRAVNNHQPLIEALKAVLNSTDCNLDEQSDETSEAMKKPMKFSPKRRRNNMANKPKEGFAMPSATRCQDCKWVHEADSVRKISFMGVELCPLHAAAPELLKAMKDALKAGGNQGQAWKWAPILGDAITAAERRSA